MSEHMTDPTPHETPEAEEVEALTEVILGCSEPNEIVFARAVLAAGYRKADPARDAELRAEGAREVIERVEVALADLDDVRENRRSINAADPGAFALGVATNLVRAALTEAGDES